MKINKLVFSFLIFLSSCTSSENAMEGTFEDVSNHARTKIRKVTDGQYEIIAEFNPALRFVCKRNKNLLNGYFQGKLIEIEFNTNYDTITSKDSGKIILVAKRIE